MALNITETKITSTKSGNEYKLFIFEDRAIGCTCMHRQKQMHVPCKHMREYNQPKATIAPFSAPTFDSCVCCGERIKIGAVMCHRCSC